MSEICKRLCPALLIAVAACGTASKAPLSEPEAASSQTATNAAGLAGNQDPMEFASRVEGSTFIEILEVVAPSPKRLLYCTGVRGLQVVDTSNPDDTKVVAELKSSRFSHKKFARCQHVAIDGDLVYFSNRGDMIQKVPFITGYDLSTSPPTELINYTAPKASFEGMAAHDGKLYVAMHERGLAIMQPAGDTLVELAQVSGFKAAWAVAVKGDYAYVADATGLLGVVKVSDPKAPKLVATIEIEGSPQSIALSGTRAFIAAAAGGLAVVDVSNPQAPVLTHRVDTGGSALQVSIDKDHAYVANWGDARVYDISGGGAPTAIAIEIIKTDAAVSRVLGMSGIGDKVYVGEWSGLYSYTLHADRKAPHISTSEMRLDFERTPIGATSKARIIVSNEGSSPLVLETAKTSGTGFSVTSEAATLSPGKFVFVEVVFSPTSAGSQTGELVLRSNDPDDSELRVPLEGNHEELQVGDLAPEVSLALIDGGQWKLSEQRGKVVLLSYFATF